MTALTDSPDRTGLIAILQCPACTKSLQRTDGCDHCNAIFMQSHGQPVLIDFADSIFQPEVYQTHTGTVIPRLQRGSRIGRFLGRLTYGKSGRTQRNIATFVKYVGERESPRVLVVGGGSIGSGTEQLYDSEFELVAVDVFASPNTAFVCDGHKLPFADESFDAVLIQAVLEHVLEPQRVVDEIHRVLQPGGIVYAETPFMQQVHEQAYDFTRYTLSGHRWLFRRFAQLEAGSILGPGIALLWSISSFIKGLGLGTQVAALVTAPFFWVRLFDNKMKPGPAADAASGLYFLGRKSDETLKPRDMPEYYRQHR